MNESDSSVAPPITLDKAALGLTGNTFALFAADGKSRTATMRNAPVVTVPPKGLVALSFPTRPQAALDIPPLANGRATQQLGGEWGALEAFRIRSPFGKDSLYVVLTGRPKDGASATLQIDGAQPLEKKTYPYEFSVYPWPMKRDLKFALQLKDATGAVTTSQPVVLPGTKP